MPSYWPFSSCVLSDHKCSTNVAQASWMGHTTSFRSSASSHHFTVYQTQRICRRTRILDIMSAPCSCNQYKTFQNLLINSKKSQIDLAKCFLQCHCHPWTPSIHNFQLNHQISHFEGRENQPQAKLNREKMPQLVALLCITLGRSPRCQLLPLLNHPRRY